MPHGEPVGLAAFFGADFHAAREINSGFMLGVPNEKMCDLARPSPDPSVWVDFLEEAYM
jgi:hypothetical protein